MYTVLGCYLCLNFISVVHMRPNKSVPAEFNFQSRFSANESLYRYEKAVEAVRYRASGARIVGGSPADPGDFPYHVSIQSPFVPTLSICGGSIITRKCVLTAAHCIMIRKFSCDKYDYVVASGVTTLTEEDVIYHKVHKCYEHPEYDDLLFNNDISVIVIVGKFKYGKFVQPVPLARKPLGVRTRCVVTGWGSNDTHHRVYPENLLALTLISRESEVCYENFPVEFNDSTQICAGGLLGKDTCDGDSGGPLVCDHVLYGVTSYGSKQCAIGRVGVFVNIYHFRMWIDKLTEEAKNASNDVNDTFTIYRLIHILIIIWLNP